VSPGAGELLAVGFEGTAVPEAVSALAAEAGLGGVVLFARNCPTLEAVLGLTAAARRLGPDVLVLVDHEGGRVHRLPPPFTRFPAAATIGRTGDPGLAASVARAMARELRAAGFDSGLAPVLDCLTAPDSVAIGDRAYAGDPDAVAACGVAFVRAALEEGLVPVAKHFPGHGRTALDSHVTLPEVDASLAELERTELPPFRRALAAGCPAVLVAHVRYPALDPEWPASLSADVIGKLLRRGLGFAGLVLSDDLEMAAVRSRWGVEGAAVRFLAAGGDLALVCREAEARARAAEAIRDGLERGALAREVLAGARERRAWLRAWVDRARPRPDPGVIGCPEHRALLAEIHGRAGDTARDLPAS
jgi:beta-N-acetylhexosaminidase